MKKYDMQGASLEVKQGFAYLADETGTKQDEQMAQITDALSTEAEKTKFLQDRMDSIENDKKTGYQVYQEIKAQYSSVRSGIVQRSEILTDSNAVRNGYLISLDIPGGISPAALNKMKNWLRVRLNDKNIHLIIEK